MEEPCEREPGWSVRVDVVTSMGAWQLSESKDELLGSGQLLRAQCQAGHGEQKSWLNTPLKQATVSTGACPKTSFLSFCDSKQNSIVCALY